MLIGILRVEIEPHAAEEKSTKLGDVQEFQSATMATMQGRTLQCARKTVVYLLLGAAIVKISILLINGPSFHHDSGIYVSYADAILDHNRAFAPVVWGAEAIPAFIFRFPGYPLILAGAKLVAPAHYAFVTVIFQCWLNGVATYLIFRVTERLLQSSAAALLVTVLYIFSASMLWDNSILSDSIYGSLFNIVIFGLLGSLIGCWRLTLGTIAVLAALWGYSILTRDSGLYFTVFPIMLTIAIAARSEGRFVRRIGYFLVFVVVTSAMTGVYVMLNRYRTGEAFFSITGLENWLHPVFDMARFGYARPFMGDDLVSRTVRQTMTGYEFNAQKQFLRTLHEQCQCTPTQEQSLIFGKYLSAIWYNPIAYLRVILGNLNHLLSLIADPVATINQFVQLGTPIGRIVPGLSLKNVMVLAQHFSLTAFVLMFLGAISTITSTIVLLLFVFGVPLLVLREWRTRKPINDTMAVISFLWLTFMSVSLAFCMVHFEARYALPVLPAALVGVVYMLQRSRAGLQRWTSVKQFPELSERGRMDVHLNTNIDVPQVLRSQSPHSAC